jgi:Concanavalin A-like lectin/glucanases superfamily
MNITVSTPGAGIVAHYQFDGTTLNTSGGGAGTTTGSPAYEDAVFDRALAFDGVNDFVTMPANIVGMLTDATFAMRVRWRGGAAWQRVFDFGAGSAQYMIFTPSSGSGTAQFAILNSGGTTQRLAGPEPLPVGEWCHVAVTLIGNTGTLYVNGAAVAATSITLDPASIAQTANYLGDSQFTADPLFDGALDDLRIYNRGLSAAEVAALASPPPGMSVPLDYAGWTTAYNFPGGQTGALANADNDELLNIWEFFHATNPLTHTTAPIAAQALGGRLAITFPRSTLANDVTVSVQGADSPVGPWTDLARSINGAAFTALVAGASVTESGSGTTRTVEFRDMLTIGDPAHPQRHLRLRLEHP